MDLFEEKYGIKEDEHVKALHLNRRMFCVKDGNLIIADSGLPCSHATWFKKEGWMSEYDDTFIKENVRGQVDYKGDIYFYIGWDFQINNEIEAIFFNHLGELVNTLELNLDSEIFGGLIRQENQLVWPPRKSYGKVKNLLNIK